MSSDINVAVIGAGPYGLSIAAHLNAAGVDNAVFGVPMESWEHHMPPGMFLKSYGESSSLYEPGSRLTLEAFCRENGAPYDDARVPVRLDTFIAYGKAFQQRFVPRVETRRLARLARAPGGFALQFADGQRVNARSVVLAIGVVPYKYLPPALGELPTDLVSHSSDFGPLDRLAGKSVAVLGSGSSALDLAALLHQRGSRVTVIARQAELHFQTPPGPAPSALRRLLRPSSNGLGDGWLMCLCADAPGLFRQLPERTRVSVLGNTLGPSGGYFIRDQIEGQVSVRTSCTLAALTPQGSGLRLSLQTTDGRRETVDADRVVAATGYRVDVRRLDFLDAALLRALRVADQAPELSADYESSVPGLYFAGLSSARTFGPAMRFVVGAVHPARRLARRLADRRAHQPVRDSAATPA